MRDWHVLSSTDANTWTDNGAKLSIADFSWVGAAAWAEEVEPRNGKYYWYVPVNGNGPGWMDIPADAAARRRLHHLGAAVPRGGAGVGREDRGRVPVRAGGPRVPVRSRKLTGRGLARASPRLGAAWAKKIEANRAKYACSVISGGESVLRVK